MSVGRVMVAVAAVLWSTLGVFGDAHAAERQAFSAAKFQEAQAANARILVDIAASWCPTCKAQKPIIEAIAAKPENKDLFIFEVDFDTQKDAVRAFNARMQSTLIMFRGETETGRSVGDTDPNAIAGLIESSRGD